MYPCVQIELLNKPLLGLALLELVPNLIVEY